MEPEGPRLAKCSGAQASQGLVLEVILVSKLQEMHKLSFFQGLFRGSYPFCSGDLTENLIILVI